MALPKQKQRKEPKARDEKPSFDPHWNRRAGTVASVDEYVQAACREPKGFHRGARIR